jgi:hypothetical protein
MENTHENLEHIEHTQHAAHDQFNRNVAVSMAIVAAVLAGVTVLSHWAHNETLLKQMEATDSWNYYQAKKNREGLYLGLQALDAAMAKDPSMDKNEHRYNLYAKEKQNWEEKASKYGNELRELEEEARSLQAESRHWHQRGVRYDIGQLFVELSLVLCSIAILTKRSVFWFTGIGAGALGAAIAVSAFLITR